MFGFFLAVNLVVAVSGDLKIFKPIQDHPYLVSIHNHYDFLCTGAIISPNYVITTAKCITKYIHNGKLIIRSGSSDVNTEGDTHEVTNAVCHDKYVLQGTRRTVHDIAVLQVDTPFKYNDKCKSIQLFEASDTVSEDRECLIIRWLYVNREYFFHVSRAPIVKRLACERIMLITIPNDYLPEGQICALAPFIKDDSGSLMIADGRLAGIGSWGSENFMPSMFTEIAAYRDWIGEHTDVPVNFMPKISGSILLIVLIQVCIVIMRF